MKYLFLIGNGNDRWIDVPEDREYWCLYSIDTPKTYSPTEEVTYTQTIYKKLAFRGEEKRFWIFAPEKMTCDEVLAMLIMGYPTKKY